MKKFSLSVFVAMLVIIFTATSCLCPATKPVQKQQPQAKKVVPAAPGEPVVATDCCDVCCLIRTTPKAPREAIIGQTYMSEVDVEALQNAGEVQVMTRLPPGLRYVKSEPPADMQGNKLVWNLGNMSKGAKQTLKVWVVSDKEGAQLICYTPFALPIYCVETMIGRAELAIIKAGPATATLGSQVTYTIVVENKGTAVATGVTVTDQVPQGLVHDSGSKTITFPAFDLAPKSKKELSVALKAAERGRFCNVAVATSTNAGQVQAQACTEVKKNDFELNLTCPKEALVGQRGNVSLSVANTGDMPLTNVAATIEYPAGVQVVSSDCTQGTGGQQVWRIGTLNPGTPVTCNAVLMGQTEGTHCVKVTVSAAEVAPKTSTCCTVWKGVAKIQIVKSAPATAQLNETFNYSITVSNVGTGVARDVVVTDTFPPEVSYPQGTYRQAIGDLAPGASRTLPPIPVKAIRTGTARNVANATASNAEPVQAEAITVIQEMNGELLVLCPEMRHVNTLQRTEIVFKNTGGVAFTNVTVTARWSPQVQVRNPEGNPVITGQQAVWTIPTIGPREQKSVILNTVCIVPGRECIEVMVNTAQGFSKSAKCCTEWKGQPALLLEVIDTDDPIAPNQETTYVIEVTNQGTADDQNVQIVAIFPGEIAPVRAEGPIPVGEGAARGAQGSIQGNRVVFQVYPVLQPKKKVKYTILSKGVVIGDSRLKVELTSELLKKPVTEEESTHVY